MFKDRLKKAMKDLHLNQVQVSGMTGRSRASICQYLAGAQVPPDAVQQAHGPAGHGQPVPYAGFDLHADSPS